MTPSTIALLSFFSLLVLLIGAQNGAASSHASYKLGSRQVFFMTPGKSPANSHQTSKTTTCPSSTTTGLGNRLPVVHRQSPCSPLQGLLSLTTENVLRRDASLIRQRSTSQSSQVGALAPSPATTIIPANGTTSAPGALDYSVLVSYGTPKQQFPVLLDTSLSTSMLRCKPCTSGSKDCEPAFDTSRSSTFAPVRCGSPACPTNCSSGSFCPYDDLFIQGTYAQDTLTLATSMAIEKFRFVCLDVDQPSDDLVEAGILDLSRDRNSLPSRLSSSSFSYCLPASASSEGFLYLGGNTTTAGEGNLTVHAPLVSIKEPRLAGMYFIDLIGMSLGDDVDLPIPPGTFGGNASSNLDVGTTFTMLAPAAYTTLRDSFRRQMSQYNHLLLPGLDGFDTCYNFTGLHELTVPVLGFKFSNGESLDIYERMLYQPDPHVVGPFTVTCLAFSALQSGDVFSAVIGTYMLASTEVVYDVAGGQVGFITSRC